MLIKSNFNKISEFEHFALFLSLFELYEPHAGPVYAKSLRNQIFFSLTSLWICIFACTPKMSKILKQRFYIKKGNKILVKNFPKI